MSSDPQSSGRPNEVSQSPWIFSSTGFFYWLQEGGGIRAHMPQHTCGGVGLPFPPCLARASWLFTAALCMLCAWGDQGPTLGVILQESPTSSVETGLELAKTLPRRCGSWPGSPEILLALLPQYWDSTRLASYPAYLRGFWVLNSSMRSKCSELTPCCRLLLSQRTQVDMFDGHLTLRS